MEKDSEISIIRDKSKRFNLYLDSGIYNQNELTNDILYKIILYSISLFGTEEHELNGTLDDEGNKLLFKENWRNIYRSYSGDSTLFELGCFLYFLIDKWLRKNKPKINIEKFFSLLLNDFIKEFNKIFGHVNSRDFYKQRYSIYKEIKEEQDSIENYFFYIKQFIYLTRDNTFPKKYEIESITYNVPFTDLVWIRINFMAWYASCIPNIFNMLKLYLNQFD